MPLVDVVFAEISKPLNKAAAYGEEVNARYGEMLDAIGKGVVNIIHNLSDQVNKIKDDKSLSGYGKTEATIRMVSDALKTIDSNIGFGMKRLEKDQLDAGKALPKFPTFAEEGLRQGRLMGNYDQPDAALVIFNDRLNQVRSRLYGMDASSRKAAIQTAPANEDAGLETLLACLTAPKSMPIMDTDTITAAMSGWLERYYPKEYTTLKTVLLAMECLKFNSEQARRNIGDFVGWGVVNEIEPPAKDSVKIIGTVPAKK